MWRCAAAVCSTVPQVCSAVCAVHCNASIQALLVVMQLVAKWRAISSAARSEGVHNHYQAIRQKASHRPTPESVVSAKPIRLGSGNHIVRTQDLVSKLYENGYIKPKMIRIRLLHYWICRLLGKYMCTTNHNH